MKKIILALNGGGIVIAHLIGAINTIIGMYKLFDSIIAAVIGGLASGIPFIWPIQHLWFAGLEYYKLDRLTIHGEIAICVWLFIFGISILAFFMKKQN